MNHNLVIVESPAKAKTITKYLGKNFKTVASYGHISEIPSKKGSIDPEDNFATVYQVPERSEKYLQQIIKNCHKADKIFLATDPDREGEAIAFHVVEELQKRQAIANNTIVKRITFNSITKDEIIQAIENPREIDMSLVEAQKTRRALDYLVGFNLSPVLWRKIPGSMSAGRVQSVALRLICERDNEILRFKPEEFWTIEGVFLNQKKEELKAKLTHLEGKKLDKFAIPNEKSCAEIANKIKQQNFHIQQIKKKQSKSSPPAPYTTSSLQQDASSRLGFSPKRTMQIAQKLYEGIKISNETTGLITYMRTDGIYINDAAIKDMRDLIKDQFGQKYLSSAPRKYQSKIKNAQEAHEAVRPTDFSRNPENLKEFLDEEQFKLYRLIWSRTVASQMSSAIFDQTNITIASQDESSIFSVSGSILQFEGFQKVYTGRDKDSILPPCQENDQLESKKIIDTQNFTQPPAHFSEASLIKKLEELGIGRPSTYTTILSVLQDRKYVVLEKKKLISEQRGKVVSQFLQHFFSKYVDYSFTANLENQLDEISNGKAPWLNVLQDFWQNFIKNVEEVLEIPTEEVIEAINQNMQDLLFAQDVENPRLCPECKKGQLGIRCSKFGIFLGCNCYPECKFIKNLNGGNTMKEDIVNNEQANYPREIAKNIDGEAILLCKGPYGLYLQTEISGKTKRAALPKSLLEDQLNPDIAQTLVELPKSLGTHSQTQKEIKVGLGKFGAYLAYDGSFISLKNEMDIFNITLEEAIQKIDVHFEKLKKSLVKTIGMDKNNNEIGLYKNRFGPFLLQGNKRIKIAKNINFNDLSIDFLYEHKIIR